MTAPIYPSSLPCWHTTPQTIQPKSGAIQSEMESGAVRIRRTRTAISSVLSVETTMSRTQAALFFGFYEFDALCGEQPVSIPVLGLDGVSKSRLVRILPDPQHEAISGDMVKVSARLVSLESTGLTEVVYRGRL